MRSLRQIAPGATVCVVVAMGLFPAVASAAPPITFATEGQGAGRVNNPAGVAVDQSSGDVYVADEVNFRIDKFDSAGNFILAFGWGVLNGAEELQVCTTTCQEGLFGSAPGEIRYPRSIVVDNSGGPSGGDIYVSERGSGRVEKFSPAGEFLLMFGGEVDKTTGGDLCTAEDVNVKHDTCGAGVPGTGTGEIGNAGGPLAVDVAGNVWLGDAERLEQFSSEGAFLSEIAVPGAITIAALAIDTNPSSPSFEDFYAIYRDAAKGLFFGPVHKLSPAGVPLETLDEAGAPEALGLDPASGELFVSDGSLSSGGYGESVLLSYDSSGVQTASFGHGQVIRRPEFNALAFGDGAERLYVVSSGSKELSAAQSFAPPAPGPLLTEGSLAAKPIKTVSATLTATLNPEDAETEYHFQYVSQRQFDEEAPGHGFDHAISSAVASLPADFAEHPVATPIAGLSAETAYRFRLLAENANGKGNATGSEEASFTTLPPAQIDEETVTDVTATSATLGALINPLGNFTEAHFEYLPEATYLENITAELDPFAGAGSTSDVPIGLSEEDQSASAHIQGLLPHTVYRYRVFAHNAGGPARGTVQAFTTQTPGPFALPDARQWQLVSAPEKHGALLQTITDQGVIQASTDGSAIAYLANAPTDPQPQGFANSSQTLSTRGPSGWQSRDIAIPHAGPTGPAVGGGFDYRFFSTDLSLGVVEPQGGGFPPAGSSASLSDEASEQTPYLRSSYLNGNLEQPCLPPSMHCYRPLVTGAEGFANVPPGTVFGEQGGTNKEGGPRFVGASPDASHVVLSSEVGLTATPGDKGGLYEWANGQLQLLSVLPLPGGQPVPPGTGVSLGHKNGGARHAISDDGSRVIWSTGVSKALHLYLRDTAKGETLQLDSIQGGSGGGSAEPEFQLATPDGSRVFFTDSQRLTADAGTKGADLYECDVVEEEGELKCHLTDLTPPGTGEEGAGVLGAVIGASDDGSSVYFVAEGALAPGATHGDCNPDKETTTCNLYLRSDGATKLVAALFPADYPSWDGRGYSLSGNLRGLTARVSPNGRWLAFMSRRSLTGYDNRDVVSAERDEEVFLYDADAEAGVGKLVCASCNPTGARPHGAEYRHIDSSKGGIVGGVGVWENTSWLAANVPGWTPYQIDRALYQSRYLSNSGRLFFNSSDALAPQDSNGTEDVYQYEPPGVGDCTAQSPTFGPASGGCVSLISSGTSKQESAFLDASENGDDVFFLTNSRLASQDIDGARDIYTAHVCSAASPCLPPEKPKAPICEGDACQNPAVPPEHPTPGTSLLDGPGNVEEAAKPKKHSKKHHHKAGKHHKRGGHSRGGQR